MSRHKKPDYRLRFLNKNTERRGTVAAGWKNPDGSISIVLNDKVMLYQDKDEVLALFPIESEHAE